METEATEGEAGVDEHAGEEAAKAAAIEAGEGSGDHTDGPEAAGAPGAAPTTDPPAAAAEPDSEEPQPGAYLKAGDGIFIKHPLGPLARPKLSRTPKP